MEQYIKKSALVAKIEKRIKELQNLHKENEEKLDSIQKTAIFLCIDECKVILSFIDTLEVKECKEVPISEDFEKIIEEIVEPTILNAYGAKELARRLRNTICDTSVSEDLEKASKEWLAPQLDKSYVAYGETKQMELTHFDGYAMLDAIEFGVNWQKQLMMKNAVECDVIRKDDGLADLRWKDENGLKKLTSNLNNGDKVKIITVKKESKV